jgi:hypothetical protein
MRRYLLVLDMDLYNAAINPYSMAVAHRTAGSAPSSKKVCGSSLVAGAAWVKLESCIDTVPAPPPDPVARALGGEAPKPAEAAAGAAAAKPMAAAAATTAM